MLVELEDVDDGFGFFDFDDIVEFVVVGDVIDDLFGDLVFGVEVLIDNL